MKKYFLALLVSVAYANDDDIDITPMIEKYAAANPVQPLPDVIAPIDYDIPKSKWPKYKPVVYAGKCKEPVALMETCKSPLHLKFERLNAMLKAKAAATRKQLPHTKKETK
jgi:hypothetical protein